MKYSKNILITGGAGFIGSHVVKLFVNKYPYYNIINVDALTYAGNLENLEPVKNAPNYQFIKADICDRIKIKDIFENYQIDAVIHLAAESHVDRSITNPFEFAQTNIIGTLTLLNQAKESWGTHFQKKRFYHISTDEVYGSLNEKDFFLETTSYDPQSPYSASKASSDHFVRAYHNTYQLPVIITNCSNNYGPNQFPEKLIPLCIHNIKNNIPIPVYGKGENIRDWLYVEDHANAIDVVFHKGKVGDTYNIGGFNEWKNIDLIQLICKLMDKKLDRKSKTSQQLIRYVKDRPGHDLRYAIDATKLKNELGWQPSLQFEQGIEKTIDWYLENETWTQRIINGDYQEYYKKQYH